MNIYVLGLDKRMAYCAARLKEHYENSVILCDNIECIYEPDAILLPYVSFKKGKLLNLLDTALADDIFRKTKQSTKLFAGMLYDGFGEECKANGITLYDYFADEALTKANADLTAEGALPLIMQNTDCAIKGMSIAITGFGRVASACAEIFSALGAKISILARSDSARGKAKSLGYQAYDIADVSAIDKAEVIVNTVPSLVLDLPMLKSANNCKYILDLASNPFGTDFESAQRLGIKAETAPGLPAKCAPQTAGNLIAEYVISVLEGQGG